MGENRKKIGCFVEYRRKSATGDVEVLNFFVNGQKTIGRNFGSNWIFLRKWAKTTTLRDWPNFGKNWIFGTVWARPESSGKWLCQVFIG